MSIKFWRHLSLIKYKRKRKSYGFTLLELLISMIIASIVTSGLLYLVNELVSIDRREEKLANVQRDMQRAIDYIADDLQEAVYVYSDPTVIITGADRLASTDPNFPDGVPVLAFWKPEPLTLEQSRVMGTVNCASLADPFDDDCRALKLRQSFYSLVVYLSVDNLGASSNTNWQGQSRIIRYTLPQYRAGAIGTTGQQTPGFVLPNNDFINWVPAADVDTAGDWDVLVDNVDATDPVYPPVVALADATAAPPDLVGGCDAEYTRSPSIDSINTYGNSDSFVACIGTPGTVGSGQNQDVEIFLRGQTKTASQEISNPLPADASSGNSNLVPTLETRVLVRGAANKTPNAN